MWRPSLLWWAAAGDFTSVVTARALQDGEEEEERAREREDEAARVTAV